MNTVKKNLSCDVPMMKKPSYMCENVTLTSFCDEYKFSIDLMNYFQNCWSFIKSMLKIHQTIVEISSNQWWNFIQSIKFLKFIWWKFYKFMTEIHQMFDEFSTIFIVQKVKKEKRRDQEEILRPFGPESDILPLY